jgi:hypothetical protein
VLKKSPYIGASVYDEQIIHSRRNSMAKGQIKSNKEVKKPKKSKEVVVPNSANNLMKPAPKK